MLLFYYMVTDVHEVPTAIFISLFIDNFICFSIRPRPSSYIGHEMQIRTDQKNEYQVEGKTAGEKI